MIIFVQVWVGRIDDKKYFLDFFPTALGDHKVINVDQIMATAKQYSSFSKSFSKFLKKVEFGKNL